jgi:hypothetical protein
MNGDPKHCELCGHGYTAGADDQDYDTLTDETGDTYENTEMYSPCCGEPVADGTADKCTAARCAH